MPAFKQNGILVWFAAFKNHVGFFPKVSAIETFKGELSGYELSKGTNRFPLNKPIPFDLVKKIVMFKVKQDLDKCRYAHAYWTVFFADKGEKCKTENPENSALLSNQKLLL